jgi:predicted XRE-type DNA-binding protein
MGRRPIWETSMQLEDQHKAKDEISYALQRIQARNQLTQRQMAAFLGTTQACVSRATRTTTARRMSYNQLFRYLSRAEPRFRLMISI